MVKLRNRTADLLKGVAVLAMIQVHIVELFAKQPIFDSMLGSVLLFIGGPPAAPVFMVIMGYFIAHTAKNNTRKSIIRGLKLIAGALLLNIGLNSHLFVKIYNQTIITSPLPYLFGVDILFLAGFSVIIISILNVFFKKNIIPYIIVIGIIFMVNAVPYPNIQGVSSYLTAMVYSDNWWSYFPIIPWLAYPITGYVGFIILPQVTQLFKKKHLSLLIFFVSLMILIFSISYGIDVASNLHNYYHHNFLYYLFVLNFIILWSMLFNKITFSVSNVITNFIEWTGRNVTVIYIFQWLLIGNIATAIYKTQSGFQIVIWFFAIVIISSVLTLLYNKVINKINY